VVIVVTLRHIELHEEEYGASSLLVLRSPQTGARAPCQTHRRRKHLQRHVSRVTYETIGDLEPSSSLERFAVVAIAASDIIPLFRRIVKGDCMQRVVPR